MNTFNKTLLVEEVPGVPPEMAWHIWHDRKTVWHGPSKAAGEQWAKENGITIDGVDHFEP